jgi:hypothetical protein
MITFLVIAFLAVALAVSTWENYHLLGEVQRLTEARHTDSRPRGDAPPARPGSRLLTTAEAAAHAGAMHAISEPYLPVPSGQHAQAWPCLTARTVPVTATDDAPPWDIPTSSFPVVDQAVQEEHAAFVRSQLPENEDDATQEDFDRALALLRERTVPELPPEPKWEQAPDGPAPEYQRNPVADVLAAEQAGRVIA